MFPSSLSFRFMVHTMETGNYHIQSTLYKC